MAERRDTAADTPGTEASTRLLAHGVDANWNFGSASLAGNIIFDYSQKVWFP